MAAGDGGAGGRGEGKALWRRTSIKDLQNKESILNYMAISSTKNIILLLCQYLNYYLNKKIKKKNWKNLISLKTYF